MTDVTRATLRKFGLVVGGVFLLLGSWSWWRGHTVLPIVLLSAGSPLVVFGAAAPMLLAPVERRWMAAAHVLGRINTTIILSLLYFVMFAPLGFIRRSFSDPLDRKMGQRKDSHWVRRPQSSADPDRYRHQF